MKRALTAAALFGALFVAAPAGAQPETSMDPASERATTFQRVEGPQQEDVPGGALLVAAYGVVWALLLLYVLRLGLLQAGVARDVERLERSLAATDPEKK